MRVLSLSLDEKILETNSAVQRRVTLLAEAAGEIVICVPGVRTESKRVSAHLLVYAFGGPKVLQLWNIWMRAKQELSRKRYDLITVQDVYFLGFLAVRLAQRFSIPVEAQVHGFEKMKGVRAKLARYVLCRATRIRVVSERLKQQLSTNYQLPTTKLYVLPVYTQIEVPQKSTKRKTVPYPFTFLTVGRLVPVKNISLQIRAFAKVAEKIPHIRLRIVGDGPLKESLKLQVASLKLSDKVFFEGYQENLSRYYEEADAFLFTSDAEGWGRVVLEAAAHKLPIIMTDVGLAREVIKNEESGFIIPVRDEHELVLAMKEFLDKPELRARLGEEAFLVFKALPSPEAQIQKQCVEWQSFIKSYSL